MRDKDGLQLGSTSVTVPPNGLTQVNDVIRLLVGIFGETNLEGWLQLASDQNIVAWTSQIDNAVQDPSFAQGRAGASRWLVPSVVNVGSFRSTLAVVNLDAAPNSVQLTARDNLGNTRRTTTVTIPGRGFLNYSDVLASLGLAGTSGPMEIVSTTGKPILVISRVYSEQRTSGFFEGVMLEP
jgi:hypothetical protein